VTINATLTGLKFFFDITLGRPEVMAKMQDVRVPRKLPVILSPEEVGRLIAAAPNLKHQAAMSVAYGAGLRVSEVVALKVTRQYKLFVPPGAAAGRSLPLVVMLHGCTQDPDDFAAGTGMNALACEQGFYVLYPAQAQDANPSRCWNWFKHNHQTRDRGETAVIATMTHAVIRSRGIDPDRVYIAGLSVGGAMTALVAAAYPEMFAAVGVHSGLPPGAARSLPEGLAAMRAGAGDTALPVGVLVQMRSTGSPPSAAGLPVPAIVFHGEHDQTVHPRNGEQVVAAVLRSRLGSPASTDSHPVIERGVSTHGRRYTRSIHRSDAGQPIAEHWLVHGAGHAWSGGQKAGSYTDAQGPDASREMLRFFAEQARRQ